MESHSGRTVLKRARRASNAGPPGCEHGRSSSPRRRGARGKGRPGRPPGAEATRAFPAFGPSGKLGLVVQESAAFLMAEVAMHRSRRTGRRGRSFRAAARMQDDAKRQSHPTGTRRGERPNRLSSPRSMDRASFPVSAAT